MGNRRQVLRSMDFYEMIISDLCSGLIFYLFYIFFISMSLPSAAAYRVWERNDCTVGPPGQESWLQNLLWRGELHYAVLLCSYKGPPFINTMSLNFFKRLAFSVFHFWLAWVSLSNIFHCLPWQQITVIRSCNWRTQESKTGEGYSICCYFTAVYGVFSV